MLFVAVSLALHGGASAAVATSYSFTNLGSPYAAGTGTTWTSTPLGISDAGLIAGIANSTSVTYQGFAWQVSASGTLLATTQLGGVGSYAAVGAAGTTIVYDGQNLDQDTITSPGSPVPGGYAGAYSTVSLASGTATDCTGNHSGVSYYAPTPQSLFACNASGQVAGAYSNGTYGCAAVYGVSSGTAYQLQLVPSTVTYTSAAYCVDTAGTLVGGYSTATSSWLADWYINPTTGVVTENDLAMPAGGGTRIYNNFTNGWVAVSGNGQYLVATGYSSGREVADVWTLDSNGTVASSAKLPFLSGGALSWALGVNNAGVIVGAAANSSGQDVAVEWTYNGSAWTVTQLSALVSSATPLPSGYTLESANAISDSGQICGMGYASTPGAAIQGFVLSAPQPGDANGDGTVDVNDLTIVLTNFGKTGMTWAQGEFTGNGTVDVNDLTILLANFGQSEGASAAGIAAVPEPGALALLAAGLVVLLACSRKRR
jgi:hypothetical protein